MDNLLNANAPTKLKQLQEEIFALRKSKKLQLQNGDTGFATAPSNIAFLKYWGKVPNQVQIPANSSLSYTLGAFRSSTTVTCLGRFFPENEPNTNAKFNHKFTLKNWRDDTIASQVSQKLKDLLNSILHPWGTDIAISVESRNNFPTACGIASSASGMAALIGAIANLLQLEKHFEKDQLQYWLSEWSRIGSGSATRSTILQDKSLFVAWELMEGNPIWTKTHNLKFHEQWDKMQHCVFILDDKEKEISSSQGHNFAHTSPLHSIRVATIPSKYNKLLEAIEEFDFETIKQITEEDAFAMHAVMQTGQTPAVYLNTKVAFVISKFIQCREKLNLRAFWTLDAGPNIHFIYDEQHENLMIYFFEEMEKCLQHKVQLMKNKLGNECLILGKK